VRPRKAEIEEIIRPQVQAIISGSGVSNPHPHFLVWLGCRNSSGEGFSVLPEAGGWLDQDAELATSLNMINQLFYEEREAKKKDEEGMQRAKELHKELTNKNIPQSSLRRLN
jgi:hypothetical protein